MASYLDREVECVRKEMQKRSKNANESKRDLGEENGSPGIKKEATKMNITTVKEKKRGCGFRKPGGLPHLPRRHQAFPGLDSAR
jgi:hypothetical protein